MIHMINNIELILYTCILLVTNHHQTSKYTDHKHVGKTGEWKINFTQTMREQKLHAWLIKWGLALYSIDIHCTHVTYTLYRHVYTWHIHIRIVCVPLAVYNDSRISDLRLFTEVHAWEKLYKLFTCLQGWTQGRPAMLPEAGGKACQRRGSHSKPYFWIPPARKGPSESMLRDPIGGEQASLECFRRSCCQITVVRPEWATATSSTEPMARCVCVCSRCRFVPNTRERTEPRVAGGLGPAPRQVAKRYLLVARRYLVVARRYLVVSAEITGG